MPQCLPVCFQDTRQSHFVYPTYAEVEEFVEKAAVPYLARGTTEMLLTPSG